MSESAEIFSTRLVIADFYLEKPILGLDPCYSEFRGKEIKKVPILRIFGANTYGQKTCMHVHGVFPYFYIPYESKDFESLNKAIYQIAFSLDKAINISLGQTNSASQHVFKVQLVKGIPFYGYHRREHQFLKIYMYNPRFVRRAANLLQNGSILGKVFHPHESHVPYVLQFMIDYNLYGMSFLHVPLDIVKFRRSNDDDNISFSGTLKEAQILNTTSAKKQSCSALEVDISSNFILNRFQMITKSNPSTHSNPGIESIWNDEDVRRQNLITNLGDDDEKIQAIPALEIPKTQERPNIQPTESDAFYRSGLISKLLALENSISESTSMLDQTLNNTVQISQANAPINNKETRRTFNLKKLLANSVYPEECLPDEQLLGASYIENHLSGTNSFQSTQMQIQSGSTISLNDENRSPAALDENQFFDSTVVDEELLNIVESQHFPLNATLRDKDIELLGVLQQLEEHSETNNPKLSGTLRDEDIELLDVLQQLEEQNEFDNAVDLDSSLAPLSQPHKDFDHTPMLLDKEILAMANNNITSENESESENENDGHLQDYSIALDDIDELILKLSQSQPTQFVKNDSSDELNLPQIDGADDILQKTPEKLRTMHTTNRQQITPPRSPRTPKSIVRSPRTPKSSAASKYAPLSLVVTNHSAKKNLELAKGSEISSLNGKPSSLVPLRKTLAIMKMRRKTISSTKELLENFQTAQEVQSNSKGRRTTKNSTELDKTHITCELRPKRRSERLLKFCNVESLPKDNQKTQKKARTDMPAQPKKEAIQKQTQKKTFSKQKSSSDTEVYKKNPYGLKKVLVRLPRKNLLKLAEAFQRSREKSNNNKALKEVSRQESQNELTENVELNRTLQGNLKTLLNDNEKDTNNLLLNEQIVERDKNPSSSELETEVSHKTIDNNIRKNLSQLCKAFQPDDSKLCAPNRCKSIDVTSTFSTAKSKNENCTEGDRDIAFQGFKPKSLRLGGKFKRSPLSLNRKSNKKLLKSYNDLENIKEVSNDDHIRKNLSELTKVLQNMKQFKHHDGKAKNLSLPEHDDSELSETGDVCFKSLRIFESSENVIRSESENMDDVDEEIAASDAEEAPTTSLSQKMEKTSSFKRLRRKLRTKSPNETSDLVPGQQNSPETPSTNTKVAQNFFDLSLTINSPSIFSELSSPVLSPKEIETTQQFVNNSSIRVVDEERDVVVLTPLLHPPTREEALKTCEKLQIYEYEFQKPFYSNPDDVTKAKEVGFTVLQIAGNKLCDYVEFESVLGTESDGLAEWRRKKFVQIGRGQVLQRYQKPEHIREFFATKKSVVIQPQSHAPSRHDAKVWLKAKELLQDRKETLLIDQDSPIKVRRQKVTMMFNDDTSTNNEDADDLDANNCSLTLTPLTPATPYRLRCEPNLTKETETTPLTSAKQTPGMDIAYKRSKRCKKSVKLSLNEKLKAAAVREMKGEISRERDIEKSEELNESLPSSQHSNYSSNDSSSISSQVVLAEMERLSFLKQLQAEKTKGQLNVSFGLSSASLDNTFGFKVNLENLHEAKSDIECNNLTSIVMEVFVMTRDELFPNPESDEIRCIFYAIENNISALTSNDSETDSAKLLKRKACGYILVNDSNDIVQNEGNIHGIDADIEVKIVKSEVEALEALLELCAHWDADIYAGYEIEMSSWGYLIDRAKFLCLNIAPLLSRVPSQKVRDFVDEDQEQFTDLDFEMKLSGRILLDVWRLMRSEIALTSYTFENVMYHILHKRCPWHSYRDLTTWFKSPCSRWIVLEYYLERVRGILALLDQLDLLGRTSEMAKLIGIQFYEVLSRGSQFRVESMMLRIAKPRNIVPLSPSVQQRAHMRAPEYLPLILEPQSRFYADPLIVLDFQSLYPSMIIAYNYCFSTCLGRVEHLGHSTPFEFGASHLRVSPTMLRKLLDEDLVTISPCGVVFVKASVREGILPRMLTEILDTRLMVKQSMKLHKSNSALQRILHSRQLGLKLMANVTYGYTAANFSGRMPAVEVGDSVVAKGRETLERTIKMVEANEKWGVKVVYGDTDSLFVLVPGRNREQAFKIGEEIAAAATTDNPHPVKLKLEKVYQPCILQTKKRYVGYMYESPDQSEPIYEAKGIETVRRDGCPAVAKMLEKVLRILFETADVSQVKQYVCRQFTKLLSGRANLQDLIFAKEFRGLKGYKPTACVPALELTRKWIQADPRRIPRRGERVPFIITNGPPGVPLIRLVRCPYDVLADGGLKINSIYYITKAIIPPLNRCLLLIGADVNEWFTNLPRKVLMTPALSTANEMIKTNQQKKNTISQYFSTTNCVVECGRHTKEGICNVCQLDATKCIVVLNSKIAQIERAFHLTQQICQACCGRVGDLKCGSLDCPVLYILEVKRRDLKQIEHFRRLLAKF